MSDKVGFGVIGLGNISRAHLYGLAGSEHARIEAVCDRDEPLVKRIAAELGARAYTDYRGLLADPAVVAVDAPLPHNLHYQVAKHALEAGKHVIIEKPMAPTSEECADLISIARMNGLTLSVAENTPFVSAYVAVKQLIDDGKLGTVRLVRTLIYGSEVERLNDTSSWKCQRSGTIGGAIFDAGPHSFYLLKWLLGEIAGVQAITNKVVAVSEVEDNALVAGRLISGGFFTTEYTFTAEIPWGERLEIYGSKGSVIVDQLLNPPAVYYRGKTDYQGDPIGLRGALPFPLEHDPKGWKFKSIAAGLAAFAKAIAENRPPPVDPADGAYAIKVVESAYRSAAAGGQLVDV